MNLYLILMSVLRTSMIFGGASIFLAIVFSGSDASIAVRDWTISGVILGEALLLGWLSARTLDRFRSPAGSPVEVQHSSRALKYGLGSGALISVACGVTLMNTVPEDRAWAAAGSVAFAMLTFGFACLMWGVYLGSKFVHAVSARRALRRATVRQVDRRPT